MGDVNQDVVLEVRYKFRSGASIVEFAGPVESCEQYVANAIESYNRINWVITKINDGQWSCDEKSGRHFFDILIVDQGVKLGAENVAGGAEEVHAGVERRGAGDRI